MPKTFSPLPRVCLLVLLLATPTMAHAGKMLAPTVPTAAVQEPPATPAAEQKQPEAAGTEHAIRIGFVDLTRFGAETEAGKAAREKVRKKSERLESQVNARQKLLEKQKTALQVKLLSLPPKEQEAKAKEFEKKVEEHRKFLQSAEKEMKGYEAEVTRQLYQDIEDAAAAFGKANGYAAVIVRRDLLYIGSGVEGEDVTTKVLKIMNAKREKK